MSIVVKHNFHEYYMAILVIIHNAQVQHGVFGGFDDFCQLLTVITLVQLRASNESDFAPHKPLNGLPLCGAQRVIA